MGSDLPTLGLLAPFQRIFVNFVLRNPLRRHARSVLNTANRFIKSGASDLRIIDLQVHTALLRLLPRLEVLDLQTKLLL